MRILKRVLLTLLVLIVATMAFIYVSLRANIPSDHLAIAPALATPNNGAPILIFGATRNTGLELAKRLHARGERVFAFVRDSSNISELNTLNAELLIGDAMDPASIETALASQSFRGIVTTVGCFSCDPPVDFTANKNIVDAAKAAKVPYVMLISSIGAGDSLDSTPFITKFALKRILPLKTKAEQYLRMSGLQYTIIRPGGLSHGPETGTGILTEDSETLGFIDRSELSTLMLACLDHSDCMNKTLAAIDKNRRSPW